MQSQSPAQLVVRIGQSAPEGEHGTSHRTGRENDDARARGDSLGCATGPARDCLDPDDACPLARQPNDLGVRVDASASVDRLRNQDFDCILFGVVGASELAETALLTADAIVPKGPAAPAQCLAPLSKHLVVPVSELRRDLADTEIGLDTLERRGEVSRARSRDTVPACPNVEHCIWGTLAKVGVVDGAAAHSATLQHAYRHVLGRPPAGVLEQSRQHVVLALIELTGRRTVPFLERYSAHTSARELPQDHRAACSGPYDHRIRIEARAIP
jgi:hypothetical protein